MGDPPRGKSESGPIESLPWPNAITAYAVADGPSPRLHGYSVQEDLAFHYRFSEVFLLALTGELPSETTARAFNIAMIFLSPVSAGEAPVHTAVLAQLCGANPSAVVQAGVIALAEQTRSLIEQHATLLDWLAGRESTFPQDCVGLEDKDTEGARRLRLVLGQSGIELDVFRHSPTLTASLLALLHHCGLRERWQLTAAICVARIGAQAAEAFANRPGDFKSYPMNLPPFEYVEEEGT